MSLISCGFSLWLGGSLSTTRCSACLGSILSMYYRVQLQRTLDGTWDAMYADTSTYVSSTKPPPRHLLVQSFPTNQNPSLLEMFAGIICACMPAAANTCHRYLPSYDSFKKKLQVQFRSLGLKDRGSDPLFPQGTFRGIKKFRSVRERYVDLEAPERPMPIPTKSLRTFIHHGSPDDVDHDGIHLTYEMQQSSTLPPTRTGQWTAV